MKLNIYIYQFVFKSWYFQYILKFKLCIIYYYKKIYILSQVYIIMDFFGVFYCFLYEREVKVRNLILYFDIGYLENFR